MTRIKNIAFNLVFFGLSPIIAPMFLILLALIHGETLDLLTGKVVFFDLLGMKNKKPKKS
jgi:hypothetical protein